MERQEGAAKEEGGEIGGALLGGGAPERDLPGSSLVIRPGTRAGSGREALAAAHVVTCEGVRRERARRRRQCVRDARGGRSLGAAGRVVAASEFPRVPGGLPVPAASRPVAPRPFPRLPPAARRSPGDEFRHLFRDDPDYDA